MSGNERGAEMIDLRNLTYEEIEAELSALGEPGFRAKQIFSWIWRGAESFDEMSNISKTLRAKLSDKFYIGSLKIQEKSVSGIDETRKYLLKLNDGNFIESVVMKYEHGLTVCVSSQVGCRMGCAFCASTKAGIVRSLSAGEIASQILTAQRDTGERISNIVMMGIGEPLDNYDNLLRFLKIVGHPDGLCIGQRHITVSTCGIVPKIRALADEKPQITLSVSLHAYDDKTRSEIMPINRRYGISELLDACRYYTDTTSRRISFEYTLIEGVNDFPDGARKLGALLRGMLCHVNLIPVNPVRETSFKRSGAERVEKFRRTLENMGITATVRRKMGADIDAACGQLRAERMSNGVQ